MLILIVNNSDVSPDSYQEMIIICEATHIDTVRTELSNIIIVHVNMGIDLSIRC